MKTKIIILAILILAICKVSEAQYNLHWLHTFPDSNYVEGYKVEHDSYGNIYYAGNFKGTKDFNPGSGVFTKSCLGTSDIFLTKFNANGQFIWAKTFSVDSAREADFSSLNIDANNNIYIGGTFNGTIHPNPSSLSDSFTSASLSSPSFFVSKLDPNGNFLFAKKLDCGRDFTVDLSQNIYISGTFSGTKDFDPNAGISNLTAMGYFDGFVVKLNSAGSYAWSKQFGGVGASLLEIVNSLGVDENQNVYLSGNLLIGTADFDPGPSTFNLTSSSLQASDGYFLKLDSLGNFK